MRVYSKRHLRPHRHVVARQRRINQGAIPQEGPYVLWLYEYTSDAQLCRFLPKCVHLVV